MGGPAQRVAGAVVMVTGGCGFLGSHLVRRLLAEGASAVVALDSLRYGRAAAVDGLGERVRLVRHELGEDSAATLREAIAGVEYLFHFAAEKHHTPGTAFDVLRANVAGTHALLEAAREAGVRRVVFASSVHAYGRMQGPPMREDEVPRPTTAYGLSKLAGERLLGHFGRDGGPAYVALRYFFVYGPRQHPGLGQSVIVRTYERLLTGLSPTVYGDGRQALDYVYVDDAVEAALRALVQAHSGRIFNVGSSSATRVDELIDRMVRISGRQVQKSYLPADETAGTCRVADLSGIRAELGWSPRVGLDEGLALTWQWMREGRAA